MIGGLHLERELFGVSIAKGIRTIWLKCDFTSTTWKYGFPIRGRISSAWNLVAGSSKVWAPESSILEFSALVLRSLAKDPICNEIFSITLLCLRWKHAIGNTKREKKTYKIADFSSCMDKSSETIIYNRLKWIENQKHVIDPQMQHISYKYLSIIHLFY